MIAMYRDELPALQARIHTLESDLRAERKRREAEAAAAQAARASCDEAWVAARRGGGRPRRWPARLAIAILAGSIGVSVAYVVWVRDRAEERLALLRKEVVRAEAAESAARFETARCDAELRGARCVLPAPPVPRGRALLRRSHPQVITGRAEVRGTLDREIIRRVVRQHVNEIKYCYQLALQQTPNLYGRVLVHFVIDSGGRVLSALTVQSSLGEEQQVERCISNAFGRWRFPKPKDGGVVIVSYPLVLRAVVPDDED
jgi:hypothetical protein